MLLLYILWYDWPIFMISDSKEHLQQQLEYTLLKPDCHSWWISKMQSDTLEERYVILEHLAWIEYQFLCGIRDSRKARRLWGMMRGVGGVRKSEHQSCLAKGLGIGLGLLFWGFKGVQEEIPSEEASTIQISQWHFQQDNAPVHNSIPVTDYLTKIGINTVPQPPYNPDLALSDFWLFPKLRDCCY